MYCGRAGNVGDVGGGVDVVAGGLAVEPDAVHHGVEHGGRVVARGHVNEGLVHQADQGEGDLDQVRDDFELPVELRQREELLVREAVHHDVLQVVFEDLVARRRDDDEDRAAYCDALEENAVRLLFAFEVFPNVIL